MMSTSNQIFFYAAVAHAQQTDKMHGAQEQQNQEHNYTDPVEMTIKVTVNIKPVGRQN